MKEDPVARSIAIAEKALAKNAGKDVALPEWPDSKRGTPNTFLRSALFSAIQSKDRVNLKGAILASQSGTVIEYTGEQLNQEDLTLWETLVHLAKIHPLGHICEFTSYEILKAMNLDTGGKSKKYLKTSITRLIACAVKITLDGKKAYESSLIIDATTDEDTDHYILTLNKHLIALYQQVTWLDWEQRVRLKRKPLAQFLHGYYSSHARPYSIKIETIKELSGSSNKNKANFRTKVQSALEELVKMEFLESFEITDDLVSVKKQRSKIGGLE